MTGFGAALSRQWKLAFRHPASWLMLFVPVVALAICFLLFLLPLHREMGAQAGAGARLSEHLALLWTAAGLPVMLAFAAAMAALHGMAGDWSGRRYRDLGATWLSRSAATAAYLVTPILAAALTALLSFLILQAAIAGWTNTLPAARDVIFACGYTMFGALHAAILSVLVVSLLPNGGAYAVTVALSVVLPGFLCGVWLPAGWVIQPVRQVLTFFPAAHAVSLARQSLTWQTVERIFAGSGTTPGHYRQLFGVELIWAGQVIPPLWSLILLTGATLVSLAAAIVLAHRVSRADRLGPAPDAKRT